jgi:CubicO group peptidase (beta-lactamase class C family)
MKQVALAVALIVCAPPATHAQPGAVAPAPAHAAAVDAVFSKWTSATPGCAVGVAVDGRPVLMKAYGMADLERSVTNTPETVFESGSLAKQFTAMAIQLLAGDGKLSLDDPVRKYVPELPEYRWPVTIRHLLSHTSGLRDWGSVAAIAGWPRTTREYTHAHVLEIAARQQSLNFAPGTRWSYSNTGFNLAAIIVDRVSGMSFAEFSKQRIFAPLGMTKTQWRDDHTRLVKDRAIAYALENGQYTIEMPFENVHGNGGLLTTVGDLLTWNAHLASPKIGSARLIEEMSVAGRASDGTPLRYGLGFFVEERRGLHNIYHSGSTAGYRAHLNRFPAANTSVAVLCNGSNGDATRAANTVSEIYLADRMTPARPPVPGPVLPPAMHPPPPAAQLAALAGSYWSDEAETLLTVAVEDGTLVLRRRPDTVMRMIPTAADKFRGAIGTVTFLRNASGAVDALSVSQDRVWDLRFVKR